MKYKQKSNVITPASSQISYGTNWSLHCRLINLILEGALNGGQVEAFSAPEIIIGLVRSSKPLISLRGMLQIGIYGLQHYDWFKGRGRFQ